MNPTKENADSAKSAGIAKHLGGDSITEQASDYPASIEYLAYSWPEVQALCAQDIWAAKRFGPVPEQETLTEGAQMFYRLKAYWVTRGAADPGGVAFPHANILQPPNLQWEAECIANGWCSDYVKKNGFPRTLRDLEKMYLPPVVPNALLICTRCPVLCQAYEYGGASHSEPLWFSLLKITSKCEPEISVLVSDGHEKYTLAELNQRLERIKHEGLKPATCSHISQHSALCKACEWFGHINSPIALGYSHPPKKREVLPC